MVKSGLYKAFSTCSCLVSGDMTELGFTECHVITNRSIKWSDCTEAMSLGQEEEKKVSWMGILKRIHRCSKGAVIKENGGAHLQKN